jgi:hypothetical protein
MIKMAVTLKNSLFLCLLLLFRFDCGFFTLKNLELRHGRRIPVYTQNDLLNIRKLYTDKWLRWGGNKAQWKLYV